MLEHKTLIGFAFDLGTEINFLKNGESLAETGQKILITKKMRLKESCIKILEHLKNK